MKVAICLYFLLISSFAVAGTFKDDFEDGNWAGWKTTMGGIWNENVGERAVIKNGILRMDAMNMATNEVDLYIIDDKWKDYKLSVDMKIVQVEAGTWPGGAITARWEQFGGYDDYALFGAVVNGWNARSNTTRNGVFDTVWNQKLPIISPRIGEWHRAEIQAIGNDISFYIDNNLQLEQKDDKHPTGGVVLVAYDAVVEFDNVIIEGPDIPDTGLSGFAVESKGKIRGK
jgi:hypothetical protein